MYEVHGSRKLEDKEDTKTHS